MNTRDAIPNTNEEISYRIRLDPERFMYLSSVRVDGGDGCISYHMAVEHLSGRKLERNEEICALKFCGISRK
jgi:hypothetical protein